MKSKLRKERKIKKARVPYDAEMIDVTIEEREKEEERKAERTKS